MPSASEIVRRHVDAAMAEAAGVGLPADVVGRALVDAAVELLGRERSPRQVAEELTFVAGNIAGEEEYGFMRP